MKYLLLITTVLFFGNAIAQDTTPPTAVCQDITVSLDATGMINITAVQVDNGSTDDVAIASLTVTPSNFTCANIGANSVTLTVEDTSGNTDTCTAIVTVVDDLLPTANCQDITVMLSASGMYTLSAADRTTLANGSTDNCGITSITVSPDTFNCTDVYNPQAVDLMITGIADVDNGLPTPVDRLQMLELYVLEDIPDLSVFGIGIANNGGGSDGVEYNFPVQSVTAGTFLYIASDAAEFNTFFGFPADFEFTALNINGNDAVELFENASVVDVFGDINTNGTNQPWEYTNSWAYRKDENKPSGTFTEGEWLYLGKDGWNDAVTNYDMNTLVPMPVTNFSLSIGGSSTPVQVTVTVEDSEGNTDSCTANVFVQDTIAPVANCQDVTLELDANGEVFIQAEELDNTLSPSTDNCTSNLLFTADPSGFFCSDLGMNPVVLTVIDPFGNSSTCTANVEIIDLLPPTVTCKNITVSLDATGIVSIVPTDVDDGSFDNCNIASRSLNIDTFNCANLGNNTVTLTVTDTSGNSASCTAIVTVEDNIPPVAICQNISVPLDVNGMASITANDINNGSTDACGIASVTISNNNFDCTNLGPNTVTLSVTDQEGNIGTCQATVTVVDTVNPVAIAKDITVSLGTSGSVSISGLQVDDNSTDNCGIDTYTVTPNTFDCSNAGTAVSVTLTVTDFSGNSATDTAMVTVEDTTAPQAACKNITLPLDANGNATITPIEIDNGSSVSCGTANLSIDVNSFSCAEVGPNNVTLTVMNANGLTASCTAVVTVVDNLPPNVQCQDVTVILDGSGSGTISTGQIDNGTSDACGIASLSLDRTSFDCTDIGQQTVTLTAVDNNGNSSSCTAIVTVMDNIPPTAVCQNITLPLDVNGMATITPLDIDGGSTDFCGITSRSIDVNSFDCSNIGANSVVLTVTDGSGNTNSCTAIVTVVDTTPPIASCQNITINLDATGSAFIQASDIDAGSTDACGIASISLSNTIFNCSQVGSNSVILTVTDTSGNSSFCTAIVTVQDVTAPTVNCQDITVTLDESGVAFISEIDIDAGSFDACGLSLLTLDQTTFTCDDIGANTVTLSAGDIFGNTATCTATVTVLDTTDPMVNCPPDYAVEINSDGEYIVANFLTEGIVIGTDNCEDSITLLSQDPAPGTVLELGTYPVTITIQDGSGNTDSCSFDLFVVEELGIVDAETLQLKVFPNPVSSQIHIQSNEALEDAEVVIYDLLGRPVWKQSIEATGILELTISMESFPSAVYFLKVISPQGNFITQLIKE